MLSSILPTSLYISLNLRERKTLFFVQNHVYVVVVVLLKGKTSVGILKNRQQTASADICLLLKNDHVMAIVCRGSGKVRYYFSIFNFVNS